MLKNLFNPDATVFLNKMFEKMLVFFRSIIGYIGAVYYCPVFLVSAQYD